MYITIGGTRYGAVTLETAATPVDGETCTVYLDEDSYEATVDGDTLTVTYPETATRTLFIRFSEAEALVYEIRQFGFIQIAIQGENDAAILESTEVGAQEWMILGDTRKYTEISDLDFEPETDVTGSSVPINELWASIHTTDSIDIGERISLYDDLDNLWARYWVTYAEHEEGYIRHKTDHTRERGYTLRVHGESALIRLETVNMDAAMYQNEPVNVVLAQILEPLGGEYSVDSTFDSKTISGFCPKQSARVRLQWVCMAIGAYVRNFFNDILEISAMDESNVKIIPIADTYWKPKITYRDHVTAVRAIYYSFEEGTPASTDKYVTVGDKNKGEEETHYIQTSTEVTLINGDAPEAAPENVVEIANMTLINASNVGEVLSFLAKYHFKRTEVDLSCINNGQYMPAQKVMCYTDEETMYVGYINRCSFSFGVQAKSDIHMTPTETRESGILIIRYMYAGNQIDVRTHRLPIDYQYEIASEFIQKTFNGHRYVFRPIEPTVSGTMVAGSTTVDVHLEIALDYAAESLYVRSVDSYTVEEDGIVKVK